MTPTGSRNLVRTAKLTLVLALALGAAPETLAAAKRAPSASPKKSSPRKNAAKKPAPTGKLTRPDAPTESPKPAKPEFHGELAVRRVGVAIFEGGGGAPSGFSAQAASSLCEQMAGDLTLKSYFQGECLKQKIGSGASDRSVADLAAKRAVDGVVVGRFEGGELRMAFRSGKTGRVIANLKASVDKSFNVEAVADDAVDAVAQAAPYRGFITRAGDTLEINLGTRHGMQPGMLLKVFEFEGAQPTLASPRNDLGVVQVVEARESSSKARIFAGRGPFDVNAKISHAEVEPPKEAATERVARDGMWFTIGTELTNVDTETDPRFNDRRYVLKNTPFLQLGLGGSKWFAQLWYGSASNEDESVAYAAAMAAFQMASWGNVRSGFTLSGGLWLSQYSATTRSADAEVRLKDSVRYSPYVELRYQYQPSKYFRLFAAAEAYYPIAATGQATAMLPFSYGIGLTPGLRIRVTDGFALEAGARLQRLALPLSGNLGADELQTGYFLRALIVL